jgi:hypothetical protein
MSPPPPPNPITMQQGTRDTTMAPREMNQPKRTLILMVQTEPHIDTAHTGPAAQAALMGFVCHTTHTNLGGPVLQIHSNADHTKGTLVLYCTNSRTGSYGHKRNGGRPRKRKKTANGPHPSHMHAPCQL